MLASGEKGNSVCNWLNSSAAGILQGSDKKLDLDHARFYTTGIQIMFQAEKQSSEHHHPKKR